MPSGHRLPSGLGSAAVVALAGLLVPPPARAQTCTFDAGSGFYLFSGAEIASNSNSLSCSVGELRFFNFRNAAELDAADQIAIGPSDPATTILRIQRQGGYKNSHSLSYDVSVLNPAIGIGLMKAQINSLNAWWTYSIQTTDSLTGRQAFEFSRAEDIYEPSIDINDPATFTPAVSQLSLSSSLVVSMDSNPMSGWITAFSLVPSAAPDVPGPLPLAGVAAGFGISRGLRRRISAARDNDDGGPA